MIGEAPVAAVIVGDGADRQPELAVALSGTGKVAVVGRTTDRTLAPRLGVVRGAAVVLLLADEASTVDLLTRLLEAASLPVVVVAKAPEVGVRALAAGAAEVLPASAPVDAIAQSLSIMSKLRVVRRRGGDRSVGREAGTGPGTAPSAEGRIVGIGASTGGPVALVEILRALPRAFPVPVLLVQHMPKDYTEPFAQWLESSVSLAVEIAFAGASPKPGTVHLAPATTHLAVTPDGRLLTPPPVGPGPCPSADRLFESLARAFGRSAYGVLLSGMGRDGARGLRAMRDAGAGTVVQDGPSSAVFGMPAAALELGAADLALPPARIGERLLEWAEA